MSRDAAMIPNRPRQLRPASTAQPPVWRSLAAGDTALLARILHERRCCNRGLAAETSLHGFGAVHERGAHYFLHRGPHEATARFRDDPS